MAKLGQQDPRWLVETRNDGKNVNQWHWTEKDLFPVAKEALTKCFKGMVIAPMEEGDKIVIKSIDSITGDVTLQGRKGRAFFVHDVTIKLKWEAKHKGKDSKGLVKIIDIINDDDDWVVQVTLDKESTEGREVKEYLRTKQKSHFKAEVKTVLDAMMKEWLELAKQGQGAVKAKSIAPAPAAASPKPKFSKKFRTLEINLSFNCPPNILYDTLLDPQRMSAVTGSQAIVSKTVGSDFALFNGSITGKTTALEPNAKISQDWRFATWPDGHYSKVVITLTGDGARTMLKLTQAGVPAEDYDRTRSGWMANFWQRLRGAFGWNFSLKN